MILVILIVLLLLIVVLQSNKIEHLEKRWRTLKKVSGYRKTFGQMGDQAMIKELMEIYEEEMAI